MTAKTMKELREHARQLGLKGYSKLTKQELIARLGTTGAVDKSAQAATAKPPAGERRARPRKPATENPVPVLAPVAPVGSPRWWEPAATAVAPSTNSAEQRIESVKYASATTAPQEPTSDLGEDIDRLPALRHSRLTLLPQKPGVLHAYWALAEGEAIPSPLRLRLCQASDNALSVWQEATVAEHGHWYFHVPETADPQHLWVQLGFYHDGAFVSAARRAIARLPSLYASARTDRWWFISEHDFRQLYLRAGGSEHRRLSWSASIGSPSGGAPAHERLSWPGGISSR